MEEKKIVIPNGVEAIEAMYKEQQVHDYKGNALIEALPDIVSKFDAMDQLSVYPFFDENERELESHYRCHLIQRLFQYFQPLSNHLDLYNRISIILRQGYIARNPMNIEYTGVFSNGYEAILKNNIELNNSNTFRSSASGFTIIGVSGMGKTTTVNRILSTIPQIIVHSKYKNKNLSMYQLVWLKLECPFDGSIKALCLDFFSKIDGLLGTNYFKKYCTSRLSANAMLPIMAQVARNTNIGIIFLDEIQNLNLDKSGGSEKMLNYFVQLMNTIGLPVVLIGTPKGMGVLQSEFRLSRRNSAQGAMFWDRLGKDDNFDLLLEGVWEYQWTKKESLLTEELKDIIYEESQGIIDIAIKLYAMAQIRAISSGKEEITVPLIKQVADENLKLVKPMIDALKSGNISKIAKYEDVCLVDVDTFINNEFSKINVNSKLKELQEIKKKKEMEKRQNNREQILQKLIELDVNVDAAIKSVDRILRDNNGVVDGNEVIKEVLKEILVTEMPIPKVQTKKKAKYKEDDLRYIVSEAKKKDINAYDVLKVEGYIREYNDFLGRVM
ncbi:ATP-binding protein [Clostridium butyricum]|uniref:ATP-binding protein n=1 Tax=Clostridium butyricum TaxID=1492 RepID=UPI00374E73E6